MRVLHFAWPEGKAGAFTTSWDDGTIHDRRLVEILNRHDVKGTWNLNSSKLGLDAAQSGWKPYVSAEEVPTLYAGHEVAVHGVSHPRLERIPEDAVLSEIVEDRRALEGLVGYPVRGMALPFGTDDARVTAVLRACGIVYARPIRVQQKFALPGDFMNWEVTAHHKHDLATLWAQFLQCSAPDKLFFLWGHSYEFEGDKNWDVIDAFASTVGSETSVWKATNLDIYEYVTAWRRLVCAVEMTSLRNTSGTPLWFTCDRALRRIAPGETMRV